MKLNDAGREHSCRRGPWRGPWPPLSSSACVNKVSKALPRAAHFSSQWFSNLAPGLGLFFFFGPKQSDFDKRALLFSQGCEEGSGHEGAPEHQPQQLSSSGAADPQILASSL